MYHDTNQLSRKKHLIFIAGGLLQQWAEKNYIISPANPALVMQIACCEHGLMRTDLLLTWPVFNCGLF